MYSELEIWRMVKSVERELLVDDRKLRSRALLAALDEPRQPRLRIWLRFLLRCGRPMPESASLARPPSLEAATGGD